MATKFGVRRYPVVFVDDVLFARPKDFGFGNKEDISGGLYVPWLEPENQRRFKDDLRKTIRRRLAGETVTGLNVGDVTSEDEAAEGPSTLPAIALTDVNGKTIDAATLRNKPVVVEMWATWCPPCRAEVPNVVAVYNKFHGKGFEIIGISLDRENDQGKLEAYTKENNMPWPQFFDGKYWQNELAAKYGVNSIPAAFLLDGEGKIIGKGDALRGEKLEVAVAKALGKS